jgi:hypothetical protein
MEKDIFRGWSALKVILSVGLCVVAVALLLLVFFNCVDELRVHDPEAPWPLNGVFTVVGSGFYLYAGRKLRIQSIYLSTAVILMLAASGMVGLNCRQYNSLGFEGELPHICYGCPAPMVEIVLDKPIFDPVVFWVDACFALIVVLDVAYLCERMRNFRRTSPEGESR